MKIRKFASGSIQMGDYFFLGQTVLHRDYLVRADGKLSITPGGLRVNLIAAYIARKILFYWIETNYCRNNFHNIFLRQMRAHTIRVSFARKIAIKSQRERIKTFPMKWNLERWWKFSVEPRRVRRAREIERDTELPIDKARVR